MDFHQEDFQEVEDFLEAVEAQEVSKKISKPNIKNEIDKNKNRVLDTIRTKVVGVTFNNEDGENRQDILSRMSGSEDITVEKYTYNGEPAAYVKWGDKVIGNLSAELAGDLARKYPKARYTAEILEISGGGGYRRSGAI